MEKITLRNKEKSHVDFATEHNPRRSALFQIFAVKSKLYVSIIALRQGCSLSADVLTLFKTQPIWFFFLHISLANYKSNKFPGLSKRCKNSRVVKKRLNTSSHCATWQVNGINWFLTTRGQWNTLRKTEKHLLWGHPAQFKINAAQNQSLFNVACRKTWVVYHSALDLKWPLCCFWKVGKHCHWDRSKMFEFGVCLWKKTISCRATINFNSVRFNDQPYSHDLPKR